MINNVVLVGRMTRDAELRYTPQIRLLRHSHSRLTVILKTKMVNEMRTLSTV